MNPPRRARVRHAAPGSGALAAVGFRFAVVGFVGVLVRVLLTAGGAPIVRWYYLAAGVGLAGLVVALPRLVTLSRSAVWLVGGAFFTLTLVGLGLPWNSRDRFLSVFNRVHVGMSEREVDTILQNYLRGTGIPNLRKVATLNVGAGSYANDASASQLSPKGCQVFRHSNSGFWNADWGIVCYRAGRVISTDFSPD